MKNSSRRISVLITIRIMEEKSPHPLMKIVRGNVLYLTLAKKTAYASTKNKGHELATLALDCIDSTEPNLKVRLLKIFLAAADMCVSPLRRITVTV